jgi:hypothetical protein
MQILLRNILAVTLGLLVGGVLNMALVSIGPRLISPPAGVDMNDVKSLGAAGHLLEPRHLLFPFLAHAIGTFGGALVANAVAGSQRRAMSFAIGLLFLAGGITAATMVPAPGWFIALDLVVAYLPMAWLASRVGGNLRREPIVAP